MGIHLTLNKWQNKSLIIQSAAFFVFFFGFVFFVLFCCLLFVCLFFASRSRKQFMPTEIYRNLFFILRFLHQQIFIRLFCVQLNGIYESMHCRHRCCFFRLMGGYIEILSSNFRVRKSLSNYTIFQLLPPHRNGSIKCNDQINIHFRFLSNAICGKLTLALLPIQPINIELNSIRIEFLCCG